MPPAVQVVVQDQTPKSVLEPLGLANGLRLTPATNGVSPASEGTAAVLQPYYEYLSYLFRRPGSHSSEQDHLELAYRDHLQACSPLCRQSA